ncbi:helix-turn-helix domain-containing protein [Escherichia coli]|uniref:helix-turn-helix domain-containing protein n=1 Tax=Escherichia coli TaxID=562 RepID=UPI00398E3565
MWLIRTRQKYRPREAGKVASLKAKPTMTERFMAAMHAGEPGYSQKAIAAMLEVSTRTIRNWKSGQIAYIR